MSMAMLGRAESDLPMHDLGYLLRYDELDIELIRPGGEYHSTNIEIAPGLYASHGVKCGKHGGAIKAIAMHNDSFAQGHAHKDMIQSQVRYERGRAKVIWSIQVPAMSVRDLGYTDDPDTAQGFVTITQHANGMWQPEMATYHEDSQTLLWRDEIYTA
jgi:hypothetical protein